MHFESTGVLIIFEKKIQQNIFFKKSPFCGVTGAPVLDFWWHLS